MSDNLLITKDEYISALAIVRAYEHQISVIAEHNTNSGIITIGTPGYWYEEKIGLEVDIRPATYASMNRAGFEKEDIALYYEVISGPYAGYLILKDNIKLQH